MPVAFLVQLRHFYRDHHHHHHHHHGTITITITIIISSASGAVKAFLQGSSSPSPSPSWHHHHHHHHHHHYCSLYLRNDQKIWITTKIHIFTKGFKHIECGRFLRDHAGFHEHKEPRVVLYKLWHDIINSHKVTKHACTFSCLPLVTQYTTYTITLQ